jgi:hypothetical protein
MLVSIEDISQDRIPYLPKIAVVLIEDHYQIWNSVGTNYSLESVVRIESIE